MNPDQLPAAIVLALICVILALGLWYLGVRRGSLKAKQFAVMIGIVPVLVIGLQLANEWFGWGNPAEFRTTTTTNEARIPVTNPDVKHQLVLTPKAWGGKAPSEPLRLHYAVQSPKGEILAQGEQELAPAQKLRWSPLRAEFQPREEGEHKLILEVGKPAFGVDIIVRELRK